MRSIVIAGVAMLALSTTAAFAGDGNDDPFHYYGSGTHTATNGFKLNANNPDNPFPYGAPGMVVAQPAPTVGPGSPAPTVTAVHPIQTTQTHS
jgi:hypothetical protein